MSKKEIQALVTEVATNNFFGDFRYMTKDDGEIWFVAKDVCKILDLKNPSDTIKKNLDEDESGVDTIYIRSKNGVEQKREVLPQIRKYGYYSLVKEKYKDREYLREHLLDLMQEEMCALADEPDIIVHRVQGEKEWHIDLW